MLVPIYLPSYKYSRQSLYLAYSLHGLSELDHFEELYTCDDRDCSRIRIIMNSKGKQTIARKCNTLPCKHEV